MRAISSVGQSWRLITAWSRVQVLAGPYNKKGTRMGVFFASQASQDLNALISSIILREL